VSEPAGLGREAAIFRSADGVVVVEVRLVNRTAADLKPLIAEATAAGAQLLWVHGDGVDETLGFRRRGGYARLEAEQLPDPVELPSPRYSLIRELQTDCFSGVWGHSEPGAPDPCATYVGLHEGGGWVGVCEFDADAGWIDGPGVIRELRTPDRYARLVRGAAARMKPGAVTLETWGDGDETIAAYQRLGFRLVSYVPGWELALVR
jgi:hypothetical protein